MIGLEQMTPAGQENTEPVVMPDDEVLYELADLAGKQLLDEDSLLEALQYRAQEKVEL